MNIGHNRDTLRSNRQIPDSNKPSRNSGKKS